MPKKVTSIVDASVLLPQEAVDALRVEEGGELEIEIVGRVVLVRSVEEAQRSREFGKIFESVLNGRREAYKQLAGGPESPPTTAS